MHLRAILAIARKDAIDVLLNRSMLITMLLTLLSSVIFLFMGRLFSGHATNILIYNPGQSMVAQTVVAAFDPVQVTEANAPADITAAFGPNGSHKDVAYDIGLIVPADFEQELLSGSHPQVSLYFNGNNISSQTSALVENAIINYSRQVASPQPPLALSTAVVNPPATVHIEDQVNTFYEAITLMVSLTVGFSLMPGLLIEEKEKKTLRMLMVTPASFTDVILGKLLVVLGYQLLLSFVALTIVNGFTVQAPLVLLYMLLGACLSLSIGLLLGGLFQTASAAGAIGGLISFIYIIPVVFDGPLGALFSNNPIIQLMKIFPTHYITNGVYNAMQNQVTLSDQLLDLGVVLGCILVLLTLTIWVLRRQSSVVVSI